jgi:hypothetical protein
MLLFVRRFDFFGKKMAAASHSIIENYEYIDEIKIDDELKCTICTQPFQKPVSLLCQHTFCQQCIELWLKKHHSCPTCRRSLIISQQETFSPVNTYIVNNQLDRLLVRCNQCYETNIQRGNFQDHELKCLKKMVRCPSADIECTWKGPRDEQDEHLSKCSFQQIRPIIDLLRVQLDTSFEIQNELRDKLENQSNQINFLLTFINKGNIMNRECARLYSKCQYALRSEQKSKVIFHCTRCDNIVRRRHVLLHACSINNHIDCICQACYEKQYPISEDTDDDEQ